MYVSAMGAQTMVVAGVLCLFAAVCLLSLQVAWAWRFALHYRRVLHREGPGGMPGDLQEAAFGKRLPQTTVLLCVRGADPSLIGCLKGLLNQDYPRYDVRIIIDSLDDPAWDVISPLLARTRTAAGVCVLK